MSGSEWEKMRDEAAKECAEDSKEYYEISPAMTFKEGANWAHSEMMKERDELLAVLRERSLQICIGT